MTTNRALIFLVLWFLMPVSFAQAKQIQLEEVELSKKALPIILIDGKKYSFRNRDYFVKLILKSRFWEDSFYVKVDLASFDTDSLFAYEIDGKTRIYLDNIELDKTHQFKKKKQIQHLNKRIKEVRVVKNSIILKDESIIREQIIWLNTSKLISK